MELKKGEPDLCLVSWNIRQSQEAWNLLLTDALIDVALLQEAVKPQKKLLWSTPAFEGIWNMKGYEKEFCAAVVGLSNRVRGKPINTYGIGDNGEGEFAVTRPGTLAAAEIKTANREVITVISVYAVWEYMYHQKHPIFADASGHRLISDLSALISGQKNHRIIVAGDWNIFFGYGDRGSPYWKARYDTVFNRMEALGLSFIGPQHPNGIQADPWPPYLPSDSKNVPTFRKRINDSASATDQLDFVFASSDLRNRLNVLALNKPEEWGPSDHCRVRIDLW